MPKGEPARRSLLVSKDGSCREEASGWVLRETKMPLLLLGADRGTGGNGGGRWERRGRQGRREWLARLRRLSLRDSLRLACSDAIWGAKRHNAIAPSQGFPMTSENSPSTSSSALFAPNLSSQPLPARAPAGSTTNAPPPALRLQFTAEHHFLQQLKSSSYHCLLC